MKLGILGEKKTIVGFRALGVETFGIGGKEDLERVFEDLDNFAILFITEEIAQEYEKELQRLEQRVLPAVLIIPGIQKTEIGKKGLKKIAERTLGSELVKI